MIKVSRHKNTPHIELFTLLCPSSVVEDETHFLIVSVIQHNRTDIYDIWLKLKPKLPFYTNQNIYIYSSINKN